MSFNANSLDTLCSALAYAMDINAPEKANAASNELKDFIDKSFSGNKADRVFMYNPDAIAQWIYEKYADYFIDVRKNAPLELPFCSVMPSVTPVCFATMYTGTQPDVHGIKKYEKLVLKLDSIFDALIRAGKKPVIVAEENSSMSKIYLEKEMDYFIYETIEEVNKKALEIIAEDKYDFVAIYNGDYDATMHRYGPESELSLNALKANVEAFDAFSEAIKTNWSEHNTLIGFAMDHGCHEIDGGCGSHGLEMEEDLNIVHLYGAFSKRKQ